jgi:hypothetical protein
LNTDDKTDDPFGEPNTRDIFAALALVGYLASHSGIMPSPDPSAAAGKAYEYADAMIARRKK